MRFESIKDEIVTIKINSGEEMISKIVEVTADYLLITNPVSIAPGQQGMGLIPSFFTAEPKDPIRLNLSAIAMVAHTADEVKVKYIEAVGGISLPPKKRLILG